MSIRSCLFSRKQRILINQKRLRYLNRNINLCSNINSMPLCNRQLCNSLVSFTFFAIFIIRVYAICIIYIVYIPEIYSICKSSIVCMFMTIHTPINLFIYFYDFLIDVNTSLYALTVTQYIEESNIFFRYDGSSFCSSFNNFPSFSFINSIHLISHNSFSSFTFFSDYFCWSIEEKKVQWG